MAGIEPRLHVSSRDGPRVAGLVAGVAPSTVGPQAPKERIIGINLAAEREGLDPSRGSREGPEKIAPVVRFVRPRGAQLISLRVWRSGSASVKRKYRGQHGRQRDGSGKVIRHGRFLSRPSCSEAQKATGIAHRPKCSAQVTN